MHIEHTIHTDIYYTDENDNNESLFTHLLLQIFNQNSDTRDNSVL